MLYLYLIKSWKMNNKRLELKTHFTKSFQVAIKHAQSTEMDFFLRSCDDEDRVLL